MKIGKVHGNYCGPDRPRTITTKVKAEAVRLMRKGASADALASRYRVTRHTIKRWGREAGIDAPDSEPDMLHEFGAWVRCRMAGRGWSQTELAERAGTTQTTVSNIMTGRNAPMLETAVKIIDALEVDA